VRWPRVHPLLRLSVRACSGVLDASRFGRNLDARSHLGGSRHFKCDARKMYNKNWDGCRDLWEEYYRKRRLFRLIDRPIAPPDPVLAEANRRHYESEQAYRYRFNVRQQERYERWQKRSIDLD
jgi:hypothetical protein